MKKWCGIEKTTQYIQIILNNRFFRRRTRKEVSMHPDEKCCSKEKVVKESKPLAFVECGIEEQILRLRTELISTRQGLSYAHQTNAKLNKELNCLKRHKHSKSGECLISIDDLNRDIGYGESSMGRALDILN